MAKSIDKREMTEDLWREQRRKSIGSSDIGAIMGLNPYRTALQVWREKTGQDEGFKGNERTGMGLLLEPVVRERLVRDYQLNVRRDNVIRVYHTYDFFTANLDFTISPASAHKAALAPPPMLGDEPGPAWPLLPHLHSGPGILEVKTATSFAVKSWENEYPLQYVAQVVWQMMVTGYSWGILAVLVDGWKLSLWGVTVADASVQALMDSMEKAGLEFWSHVVDNTPPPLQEQDLKAVKPEEGKAIEATETLKALVERYRTIASEIKPLKDALTALEKAQKEVKTQIELAAGDASSVVDGEEVLVSIRLAKRNGYTVKPSEYREVKIGGGDGK